MTRDALPIYGGAIQANKIGSFIMGGETFHIIRPGYCSQGKRRLTWTQFVHDGVPIYETKVRVELDKVIQQFESMWRRHIGDDLDLLARALANTKKEHLRKFRDGVSGEAPAPTVAHDGRKTRLSYPS